VVRAGRARPGPLLALAALTRSIGVRG